MTNIMTMTKHYLSIYLYSINYQSTNVTQCHQCHKSGHRGTVRAPWAIVPLSSGKVAKVAKEEALPKAQRHHSGPKWPRWRDLCVIVTVRPGKRLVPSSGDGTCYPPGAKPQQCKGIKMRWGLAKNPQPSVPSPCLALKNFDGHDACG